MRDAIKYEIVEMYSRLGLLKDHAPDLTPAEKEALQGAVMALLKVERIVDDAQYGRRS